MRRKEKEITDLTIIERILQESEICRIAMMDDEEPYIVPLNYGYADNTIYVHSASAGRKIDILAKNSRVCFEIEYSSEIVKKDEPCKWTSKYRSVIGYGNIEIVTNTELKRNGLDIIMRKYGYQGLLDYKEELLNRVILLQLKIDKITGKQSGDW
jgi:nitroimidazol reductase NimA-like FMN-containing flavoprotein (pyridoxamine 5'-phosphate oxidase superfamily)